MHRETYARERIDSVRVLNSYSKISINSGTWAKAYTLLVGFCKGVYLVLHMFPFYSMLLVYTPFRGILVSHLLHLLILFPFGLTHMGAQTYFLKERHIENHLF